MDDVPAGPTSPGPRRPSLSVVVPVRNGGRDFEHCLRRLRDSLLTDFELIVVDDGSTDDSAAIAREAGAVVVTIPTPRGPAAARNLGAKAATAPLIFFLDADVAVHPETLGRAMARFEADPGLAALFGSYDDAPASPGIVSQYRNLLHHFVHQNGPFLDDTRPVHTFWTGCGLIRRDVFLEFGGFDPRLYPRPAIEDIELGYRLTRAGHRIVLARDVQATHLKRWTLFEMVRTDIFRRGVPWMLLIKRTGTVESDLNVKANQKASVALTGLTLLAAMLKRRRSMGGAGRGVGSGGDRHLEPAVIRVPRPTPGAGLRLGRPTTSPTVLLLLRHLGRDRDGALAIEAAPHVARPTGSRPASRSHGRGDAASERQRSGGPIDARRAQGPMIARRGDTPGPPLNRGRR